ncbi:MAG: peptidoglycan-binding protein [Cyanobacteria bacterium P01_A01_bin.37]
MTTIPSLHIGSWSSGAHRSPQRFVYGLIASSLMTGVAIASTVNTVSASTTSLSPDNQSVLSLSQVNGSHTDADLSQMSASNASPLLISQLPTPITLQREDSGDAVSALQRRLVELGFYSGPVSGFFGELTETAVKNFQASQGLTADGVVGGSTTDALRRASASNSSSSNTSSSRGGLTIGSTGSEVNQVQTRLAALGFYSGPVTGFYGELTEAAVRSFQSANGLTVDGVVGPATLAAIQQGSQSSSSSTPDPNDGLLEQGEVGPAVADLQRRLKNLNYYNGPIDGDFGSLTVDAVTRFQRAQGLTADGVVGPATLAAISRVEGGSGAVSNRSVGNSTGSAFPSSSQGTVVGQGTVTSPPPVSQAPVSQANSFPPIASSPFPSSGGTAFPSSTSTASPEAVMALQQNLQEQGFYSGSIDGIMGFETQRAIEAARNAYGISATDFDANVPF